MLLTLIRGLPGVGKSTRAKEMCRPVFEADQFFMVNGEYCFDPSKLPAAHAACQMSVLTYLQAIGSIQCALPHTLEDACVVANTFTQRWEMQPYIQMAEDLGAFLRVIDLFDGGLADEELAARNTHGVPVEAIARMRARWESDWENSSPIRPF